MQINTSDRPGPALAPPGPGLKKSPSWLLVGAASIAGAVGGLLAWKLFLYGRSLFRQPFLTAHNLPLDFDHQQAVEAQGLLIAADSLRAGLELRRLPDGREKMVLCAGRRNFREPWARDFGFASLGLVELGDFQAVREGLEVFFLHQRPDGQLPIKVHSTSVLDRYMHSYFKREQPVTSPLKAKYKSAHGTVSLDGNALLVMAALNYVERSGDEEFARAYWPALKQAALWLEEHALADGLLRQSAFADWADSIARQGPVLYTNVAYWKALHDLARLGARFGSEADQRYFAAKARQVQAAIYAHFWRPGLGYYVTSQVFDNLSSSGNLMAIAWGLADPAQAHTILDVMDRFGMAEPVPTQVAHPAYPSRFVALENRLGGLPHYHTSAAWLWLGAWHVIALTRAGRLAEAETLLVRIAQVTVRDGVIHEVYDRDGRYLSTRWYTSEAPFSWSAGMIVHAYYVYRRHLQER